MTVEKWKLNPLRIWFIIEDGIDLVIFCLRPLLHSGLQLCTTMPDLEKVFTSRYYVLKKILKWGATTCNIKSLLNNF